MAIHELIFHIFHGIPMTWVTSCNLHIHGISWHDMLFRSGLRMVDLDMYIYRLRPDFRPSRGPLFYHTKTAKLSDGRCGPGTSLMDVSPLCHFSPILLAFFGSQMCVLSNQIFSWTQQSDLSTKSQGTRFSSTFIWNFNLL